MISNGRKIAISLTIAVLVILNILHWWPSASPKASERGRVVGEFSVADFEVKVTSTEGLPIFSRDIFQQKKSEVEKVQTKPKEPMVQPVAAKSAEELNRDAAQAEFSQIRCLGISVRNGKFQAYILNSGEPSLISIGEKVGTRFQVEKIMTDGVALHDPITGVGGVVAVSGK